jgi:phytoene desaturase
MNKPHALIIGSGLGGLATALRLSDKGFDVDIVEQYHQPGGRLNLLEKDGFRFDMGPSFFSMSYEFEELFKSLNIPNPIPIRELDPLYSVYFEGRENALNIRKDLKKMEQDFKDIEPDLEKKLNKYLDSAGKLFHDTEDIVINKNFDSKLDYLLSLLNVPLGHAPKMFRSMWTELEKHFDAYETKVIFSLVAFFLGSTPFKTPAVYSLLNYTELRHDGYWNVEGGMYRIVTEIVKLLEERNVRIHTGVKITEAHYSGANIIGFSDTTGKLWTADTFQR